MKKLGLLSVLASALMLCFTVSCDQLEDILGGGDKDSEEAFFPSAYADKEVAAWYKLTVKEDNKTKIEAVYLFTDNSLVVTKHKVYSKDDGRSPERSITAEGTYQITEGDYTTGKASVILSDGQSFEVTIENGMLFAMGESFSIQDNSKVPTPKQPVESGDNGGGNNNGGGDNYSEEAFFPSAYADKNVAAWYMLTAKRDNKTRIEAVYLFTDNTLVVTKHNIYTKEDGRSPERSITAEGTYQITEGDYTTGMASVILSDSDRTSFEVVIENGMLFAMGESFSIQDNSKVPAPQQPTGKNDQGGNNQGGEGDGIEAFFPKDCAGKSVNAWYSYSDTIFYDGYDIKYIASIYFFEDHTYVSTVNSIVTSHDFSRQECKVSQTGTYELVEGDFSTKDYKIKLIPSAGKTVTVEVSNGKFKEVDVESGEERIFTIQNNNNIPAPSEPTNNQGGNNQGDCDVPAYFPSSYAEKTVVAWYSYNHSNSDGTIVEAVFLFGDNSLIVTEHWVPSQQGMHAEFNVLTRGSFSFKTDVDYSNGSADVILEGGRKINITITDGCLVVEYDKDKLYYRQNLNDIPDPFDPNGGGSQGGEGEDSKICGVWTNDLANLDCLLAINSDGTGSLDDEDFTYTYKDDFFAFSIENQKYKVVLEGDVMSWEYVDEWGQSFPTGYYWYNLDGAYDKQLSDGRWDGYMVGGFNDKGMVFFFNGNDVEMYIIAWGEQFKGSFSLEGGVIRFNIREAYKAGIREEGSWSWMAGNLNPETLELTPGYEWEQMDSETLSDRKEELGEFTFALVSDYKAYGSMVGMPIIIEKAK